LRHNAFRRLTDIATDSAMSTGQLIYARLAIGRLGEQEQGALAAAEEAEQEAAG
jgi:hypothetical protein